MSHDHNHDHHGHHNHQTHPHAKAPDSPRLAILGLLGAVILMLAAMFMYVGTDDEELQPGGQVGPAIPAAE